MLIRKFKTNQPFLYGLLIVIAVLLWLDGFIMHHKISLVKDSASPLYGPIASFFDSYSLWSVILSFLFMLVQAFIFNRVITGKNMVDRNSQLPGLLYVVLMSSNFGLFGMHPVWFANFILILALDKVLDVFSEEHVYAEVFNVAFLVSIASLFYFPALIFILFLFAALILYFLFNARAILASLMGLGIPYIFMALFYYWFDQLPEKADSFSFPFISVMDVLVLSTPYAWISFGVIGLLTLVSLFRIYLQGLRDKPVRIRKRYQVLLIAFLVAIGGYFLSDQYTQVHRAVVFLPLAAMVSGFFQENQKTFWNELFFTLLIVMIIMGKLIYIDA